MSSFNSLRTVFRLIFLDRIRHLFSRNVKWSLSLITWISFLFYWYQSLIVGVIARGLPESCSHNFFEINLIWVLIACIFFSAMYSPPKPIPDEYIIDNETIDEERRKAIEMENLPVCRRCDVYKPPRAHHCKICQRCIPRMDHHCPILQAIFDHSSSKFMWRITVKIINGNEPSTIDHFIIGAYCNAAIIAIGVTWLSSIQLKQAIRNRTTIEQNKLEKLTEQDESLIEEIYDLGSVNANLTEVFGEPPKTPQLVSFLRPFFKIIYWLSPIDSMH
ncbi:unnamed protein product, partial [Mesorhabditis belari]|uniref:Palmitoyltransferase n=1 Tax=Mesorhabditis belari TaxID=2138241 RepID=A0AAF3EFE4_9BILA